MKPENENAHTHQKYSVNVATPINALLLGCIKAGVNLASSTECPRTLHCSRMETFLLSGIPSSTGNNHPVSALLL